MTIRRAFIGALVLYLCFALEIIECKTQKPTKQMTLQAKETNAANFMRLLVMRLVFGVASAMGLGENLSGVLGGVFVPPGAEDEYGDDYGDDYLF